MTSYERDKNNTYGHCERPKYSILSYTWGRWEKRQASDLDDEPGSESLGVKGITWKIPIIREEHFSVRMFQNVIDEMRELSGTDWVWVDVACIDQENLPIKMDEVGRQAGIFKNAWRAFVWLSHKPEEVLLNAIDVVERTNVLLFDIRTIPGPFDYSTTKCILQAVKDVKEAVETIFLDPWFSSLWTLQELFLRVDALILGQNGKLTLRRVSAYQQDRELELSLSVLRWDLQGVMREMISLGDSERLCREDNTASTIQQLAVELIDIVERGGFGSDGEYLVVDNPNVQYTAAKFRQVVRPEDRVYAICQIYDIRVGQILRPNEPPPDLESLVEEFGLAINARSPIIGQLFYHTAVPQIGRSWCITQESEVPFMDQTLGPDMQITSTISKVADGSIMATGPCCTFEDFQTEHFFTGTFSFFEIYLDVHVQQLLDPNTRLSNPLSDVDVCEFDGMLRKHYASDSVRILLLGHLEGPGSDYIRAIRHNLKPRLNYGILIHKCDLVPNSHSIGVYQRLGLCKWTTTKGDLGEYGSSAELLDATIGDSGSGVNDERYHYEVLWQVSQDFTSELETLFTETISVTLV